MAELAVGRYDLGYGTYAQVQHYTTLDRNEVLFETHDYYLDIHYMVKGIEYIGIVAREGLVNEIPYAPDNDIEFYKEPETSGGVVLHEGEYCIVGLEDGHKPRCIEGEKAIDVIKIVVKVPA